MVVWDPRANELFLNALEVPVSEDRRAYLDSACGEDAKLRHRVEALLHAHESAGDFLERPGADTSLSLATEGVELAAGGGGEDKPGALIAGRYKLVEPIGEGGMGAVWLAEQQGPIQRQVALKLIKPGMDSAAVITRFEAERQALALMDHPNIAKVHDADTTQAGRPFFVMELVMGVPIRTYCDQQRLTPRERLALFVPVCWAVQHAHQKGIIHRDLKPSNVLVGCCDGKPMPKVTDFGIAKAVAQPLTQRTQFTAFGTILSTLEYISPEQAELNAFDIDTRSDVYSLGAMLYELLTGTTPLTRRRRGQAALLEVLRLIREEAPPRPSDRLSESKDALGVTAAQRRMGPAKLTRAVRGELDWIVMKALEKDRSRRYETADALARDIERFLRGEAVEACPPGPAYRLKKFYLRHQGLVLGGALLVLALVSGIIGTTRGLLRAEAEKDRAVKARVDADMQRDKALAAEADTRGELAVLMEEYPGPRTTKSGPSGGKGLSLDNLPGQVGQQLLEKQQYDAAERYLRASLAIREESHPDDWRTFRVRSLLGAALLGQKKYADADPLLVQGFEGLEQRADKVPSAVRREVLIEALERLVQLYEALGKKDEAARWRAKLEAIPRP